MLLVAFCYCVSCCLLLRVCVCVCERVAAVVVCCCLLLFVVACLLLVVVCCCLLLLGVVYCFLLFVVLLLLLLWSVLLVGFATKRWLLANSRNLPASRRSSSASNSSRVDATIVKARSANPRTRVPWQQARLCMALAQARDYRIVSGEPTHEQ